MKCSICGRPMLTNTACKTKHSDMFVCVKCAAKVKLIHDKIISPNREPILFQTLEDIVNNEEEILCHIK